MVAFVGSPLPIPRSGSDQGLWVGSPGNLTLAVRSGDPAPGTDGQEFLQIHGVLLDNSGDLSVNASFRAGWVYDGLWVGPVGNLSLLAFSQKQPLHPHSVDLNNLVAGMLDMLHRTLGETIETRTSARSGLWPALADAGQLESALVNLAINGCDAMPDGGTLTIETANAVLTEDDTAAAAEVSPGEYVSLVVSDTGFGMPPEVLEHAFEPFFTTKPIGEGSGLRLSMVYGFAKQSNGHVTIHSEHGRGTIVQLYLPRAERHEQPVPRKAAAFEPTARGESVLVLEDDADVRPLAVSILQSLDYEVLQAENGRAALKTLERSGRVDLLLSDVVLSGGISGPQVAALAKNRYPALKILFMSGHAEDAIRQRTAFNGGIELINKPFRRRDLARKVRAALDGGDS